MISDIPPPDYNSLNLYGIVVDEGNTGTQRPEFKSWLCPALSGTFAKFLCVFLRYAPSYWGGPS